MRTIAGHAADERIVPNREILTDLRGWLPMICLPAGVIVLAPQDWPRWAFMWTLASSIYFGCKWLTWRRTGAHGIPCWRHAGYLIAWPGLDAAAFLTQSTTARPTSREYCFAGLKSAIGLALFFAGASSISTHNRYLVGWIGMVGTVLSLHFGLFHLLSCGWRHVGVNARPLMDHPIRSVSLTEFWGRRWNTAFRDLTHRFLFRPLMPWLGARGAIVGGFVFSGLVHDVVISLPARGGYGGPTLYFASQALAMLFERSALGRRFGLGRGVVGRIFTMAVLLMPLYFLFHPPFVERIMVPFMRALGAA
jgi:alginate O-acetyltransferase complex protein AlgI